MGKVDFVSAGGVEQPVIPTAEKAQLAVSSIDSSTCDSRTFDIIIIGAGPVGCRFASELKRSGFVGRVLHVGDEDSEPYNRVQLSSLLYGDASLENLQLTLPISTETFSYQRLCGRIQGIDVTNNSVIDLHGESYRYSHLVLATGSTAHVPEIFGVHLPGVFTFRTLQDSEKLHARKFRSRHCIIMGGGLLGIEAARSLNCYQCQVTIVQQGTHLMNRQLDQEAAGLLQTSLEAEGIRVITGVGVREISGLTRVESVELRDGRELQADTVLIAAGIRPNIGLARKSWISVGQGIRVDRHLQTTATNVYAIGECAEVEGQVFGFVAPGFEQAAVLAQRLCGVDRQYVASAALARLKVAATPIFSMGEVSEDAISAKASTITWRQNSLNQYRKIVVTRGRLTGVLSLGENAEDRQLQLGLAEQRRMFFWHRLRFYYTGRLFSEGAEGRVTTWADDAVVCQCMQVTHGELKQLISNGCTGTDKLAECSGASTICGGCKPLLQELTGAAPKTEPVGWSKGLQLFSWLSLVGLLLYYLLPADQVADTVTNGWAFEQIWNDGLFKQITGFTILGLCVLGLTTSMRKRLSWWQFGGFADWRFFHVTLGGLCIGLLFLHTGLQSGSQLNFTLLINFLLLVGVGALASLLLGLQHRLSVSTARRLKKTTLWTHILVAWPLPVLLLFHVLTVYYF